MYFELNDILAALAGGQTADDLADNFTKTLNEALAEQKRREEAKKEKLRKLEAEKVKRAEIMLGEVFDFCETFYPEIFTPNVKVREMLPAAELVKMMNETRDEVLAMRPKVESFVKNLDSLKAEDLESFAKNLGIFTARDVPAPTVEKVASAVRKTDPLTDFLKSNNLF